jgi:hypothetical protein
MRYGTIGSKRFGRASTPRPAWRGWAGPMNVLIVDADLATMLDRRDDTECGLRTPGRWRRRRW